MRIHSARMLDRWTHGGTYHMTLQTDGGRTFDCCVHPDDIGDAYEVAGGNPVCYCYRGGRAYYMTRDAVQAAVR